MTEPILVPAAMAAPATDRRRLVVLLAIAVALALLLLVVPRLLGGDDAEPFEFPTTPTTPTTAAPAGEAPGQPPLDSGRNPFAPG